MLTGMAVDAFAYAQQALPPPFVLPGAPEEPDPTHALSYFRQVEDDNLQFSSFVASRTAQDAADYRLYLGMGYAQSLASFARFSGRTFYGTGTYDGADQGGGVPDEVRAAADPGAWLGSNWQIESKLFDRHSFFAGVEYKQQMTMPLAEVSELLARTDSTASGPPARKVGFVTRSRFALSSEYAFNVKTRFDEGSGSLSPLDPLSTTDTNRVELGMERTIKGGSHTQLTYTWQSSTDALLGNAHLDQRLTRLRIDVPTFSTRISTGFELQYLDVPDPTNTLQDRDFVIGNVSIAGHDFSNNTHVSLGLNNVFDVKDAAAVSHPVPALPVDGRSVRVDVVHKL